MQRPMPMLAAAPALVFLLSSAAAPVHAASVTGTVIGPDGKPIAGAMVQCLPYPIPGSDPQWLPPAKTDSAGRFTVEAPALPPGIPDTANPGAMVFVHAPGFAARQLLMPPGKTDVIKLAPDAPIHGVVQDAAGKPMANILVAMTYTTHPTNETQRFISIPETLQQSLFSVKTDAKGQWKLSGVPVGGSASVLLKDPRFVAIRAQVSAGQAATAPLVARPGGVITGRVVFEDGKPAAGIPLAARWSNTYLRAEGALGLADTASGPDGTFRLTGLDKGEYVVTVSAPTKTELVAVAASGVRVTAGKETSLTAPLTLTSGGIIEGTVIDAETKKPLPQIYVYTYGPHYPQTPGGGWSNPALTDTQGRYRLRVAPGDSQVHIGSRMEGYRSFNSAIPASVKKGETKTLAPIALEHALVLKLTIVDETGKPIPDLPVLVADPGWGLPDWEKQAAKTDAQGAWNNKQQSWPELEPGEDRRWHVKVPTAWEVVEPAEIKLPAAGPIKVVLRPVNLAARVVGRVVTPDGKPVPSANINVYSYIKDDEGNHTDGRNENIQTDAEGRFTLPGLREKATTYLSAYKPDHRMARRTEVGMADGKPSVPDLVLIPLSGTVTGRLVNAAGKPVPGAWIWSPDGDRQTNTRTDAQGRFTLRRVPAGPVMIHAAFRTTALSASATPGKPLLLSLPASASQPPLTAAQRVARDRQQAMEILADLAAEAQPGKGPRDAGNDQDLLANLVARHDLAAAVRIGTGSNGKIADSILGGILENRVRTDPEGAAALFTARRDSITNPFILLYRSVDLGMAFAEKRPTFAQECYRTALAQFGNGVGDDDRWALQHVTMLALRLRTPEAEPLLQRAIAAARKGNNNDPDNAVLWLAAFLARGDSSRALRIVGSLPEEKRVTGQVSIARALASEQPVAARRILEPLLNSPAAQGDAQYAMSECLISLLEAMGTTDPAGSLALARRAPQYVQKRALALAARAQPTPAERARLYREATADTQQWDGIAVLAETALLAQSRDPAVARELRERIPEVAGDSYPNTDIAARLTAAAGTEMPALCRMLLEVALAEFRMNNPNNEDEFWILRSSIRSMAVLDPEEALNWASSLKGNGLTQARREIVDILLTPPGKRLAALKNQQ